MKQYLTLILLLLCLLPFAGCARGNVRDAVTLPDEPSALYRKAEIDDAISAAKRTFQKQFPGCTLHAIGYPGDDIFADRCADVAKQYGSEKAIILISSFETDATGGDGSLAPSATYTDWQWVLIRTPLGLWRVVDFGY